MEPAQMETGTVLLPGLPWRAIFPGKCGVKSGIAGQSVINTPTPGNRAGGKRGPLCILKRNAMEKYGAWVWHGALVRLFSLNAQTLAVPEHTNFSRCLKVENLPEPFDEGCLPSKVSQPVAPNIHTPWPSIGDQLQSQHPTS